MTVSRARDPLTVISIRRASSVVSRPAERTVVRTVTGRSSVISRGERTVIRAGVPGPKGDSGVGLPQIFSGETPDIDYPAIAFTEAPDAPGYIDLQVNLP